MRWFQSAGLLLFFKLAVWNEDRTLGDWTHVGYYELRTLILDDAHTGMSDYADMVLFAQPNTGNNGQSLTGHLLNVSYHGPEWVRGGPARNGGEFTGVSNSHPSVSRFCVGLSED